MDFEKLSEVNKIRRLTMSNSFLACNANQLFVDHIVISDEIGCSAQSRQKLETVKTWWNFHKIVKYYLKLSLTTFLCNKILLLILVSS